MIVTKTRLAVATVVASLGLIGALAPAPEASARPANVSCYGKYCYGPKGSCHVRKHGHRIAGYKEYKKKRGGKLKPTGRCVLQ